MVGPRKSDGDRGDGGASSLFGAELKDRIIAALIAIIAGGAGTAGFMNINPPRPDPWTATQAAQAHAQIEARIDRMWHVIRDIREKDEQHRRQGAHDVAESRIQRLERTCERLKEKVDP